MTVIKIMENGPILIDKLALCRCGVSTKKPYCDGSHQNCNFEDVGTEINLTICCDCCSSEESNTT